MEALVGNGQLAVRMQRVASALVQSHPGALAGWSRLVQSWQTPPVAALLRWPPDDGSVRGWLGQDWVLFDQVAQPQFQRLWPAVAGEPCLDVTRLPQDWMWRTGQLLTLSFTTHRLLESRVILDRDGRCRDVMDGLHMRAWEPELARQRQQGFARTAEAMVAQAQANERYPALALFCLAMAFAASVGRLLDGMGRTCPEVYQHPLHVLGVAEELLGVHVQGEVLDVFRLQDEIGRIAEPVAALQAQLAVPSIADGGSGADENATQPEAVPASADGSLRSKFVYWMDARELTLRLSAARALVQRSDAGSGVFLLRQAAFVMARLCMMRERLNDGMPGSLMVLRPEVSLGDDLAQHRPDWLASLLDALGGSTEVTPADLARARDFWDHWWARITGRLAAEPARSNLGD
jgi:hypothetical protein